MSTPQKNEQDQQMGPDLPIVYCYDDIKWEGEYGFGPISGPNLFYSKDYLCVYDNISWDPTNDASSSLLQGSSFSDKDLSMGATFKTSLFVSFSDGYGEVKWYCLNLGNSDECLVDNKSKPELVTNLLNETCVSQDEYSYTTFSCVDSSIYKSVLTTSELSVSSKLYMMVSDVAVPIWRDVSSMVIARVRPWLICMRDDIFIVGAEAKVDMTSPHEIHSVEVIRSRESGKCETLPLRSLKIEDWYDCYVVGFESQNKLIIGSCSEKCLYLYDISTYDLERLDLSGYDIRWGVHFPPAVVGNILFWFFDVIVVAFDLAERCFWKGAIDGLGNRSFFVSNCNVFDYPRLIYLGGGKLCLICFRARTRGKRTTSIHCSIFYVPEFTTTAGQRTLQGQLHSVRKFDLPYTEDLLDMLLT